MKRQLRPFVSGGSTARFRKDELAEAIVVVHLARLHGMRPQRRQQPELRQLADAVRLQVDPDAEPFESRRALENTARDAYLMEAQRKR